MYFNSHKTINLYKKINKLYTVQKIFRISIFVIVPLITFIIKRASGKLLFTFLVSLAYIAFFFLLDILISKKCIKNKIKIYQFDVEENNKKIKIADLRNEIISDKILLRKFEDPTNEKIVYPLSIYAIVFVLNVAILLLFN